MWVEESGLFLQKSYYGVIYVSSALNYYLAEVIVLTKCDGQTPFSQSELGAKNNIGSCTNLGELL